LAAPKSKITNYSHALREQVSVSVKVGERGLDLVDLVFFFVEFVLGVLRVREKKQVDEVDEGARWLLSLSLCSRSRYRKKTSSFTFHSVASIASFSNFRDSGVAPAAAVSEEGGWAEDMR